MSGHFWASSDSIHLAPKSGGALEFGRKLRRRWSDWELVKICNRGRYQVNVDVKTTSRIYNLCGTGVSGSDEDFEAKARRRQRASTGGTELNRRRNRRRRALSNIESFSRTYHFGEEVDAPETSRSLTVPRNRDREKYKTTIKLEYSGPFYRVS